MEQPPPAPASTPPQPPGRRAPAWKVLAFGRWGFLTIGLVVGILLGIAGSSQEEPSPGPVAVGEGEADPAEPTESPAAPTPSPTPPSPSPTPPAVVLPDPAVDFSFACDYVLGDFTENPRTGYRFIASAELTNTGNVGAVVKVVASWKQLGTDAVKAEKTVRIPYEGTMTVDFTKPVGSNEIDLHQSASDLGEPCTVDGTITDTFGASR
jgi:hypothetical protein